MQDCYVIDNNGYVVLSEKQNDTGRFFGEIEGAIMESMVDMNIYKMITVYDFQALCSEVQEKKSAGLELINVSYIRFYDVNILKCNIYFSHLLC